MMTVSLNSMTGKKSLLFCREFHYFILYSISCTHIIKPAGNASKTAPVPGHYIVFSRLILPLPAFNYRPGPHRLKLCDAVDASARIQRMEV